MRGVVIAGSGVAAQPDLRLAFAAPPGVRWLLPLYELALLSAASLRERGVADPDIVVATGEHEPLEVFGPAASEAVRAALQRAGVELVTSAAAVGASDGTLRLESGELLAADVVVALPGLVGPRISGLPHDDDGYLPVAETIASQVGAVVMPEPFRPVLRGLLLTGDAPLYVRAELGLGGRREHRLLPAPAPRHRTPCGARPARSPAGTSRRSSPVTAPARWRIANRRTSAGFETSTS